MITYKIDPPEQKSITAIEKDISRMRKSGFKFSWADKKAVKKIKLAHGSALLYRDIFKWYFKKSPLWQEARTVRQADYCNKDIHSKVKNHLTVVSLEYLTQKHKVVFFLSGRPYYPRSYAYHYKHHPKIGIPNKWKNNKDIRWFYKPNDGRATMGIQVSSNVNELIKNVRKMEKSAGVFQQEITNLKLHNQHKFEIRIYVLKTFREGQFRMFIYPEGYAILAAEEFNPKSTSRRIIFTNRSCLWYEERKSGDFTILLSKMPEGEAMLEVIREAITDIGRMIYEKSFAGKDLIGEPQYEIFAYDFMIDQEGNPWLTEINRTPCVNLKRDSSDLQKLKKEIYRTIIRFVLEPWLAPQICSPQIGLFEEISIIPMDTSEENFPSSTELEELIQRDARTEVIRHTVHNIVQSVLNDVVQKLEIFTMNQEIIEELLMSMNTES